MDTKTITTGIAGAILGAGAAIGFGSPVENVASYERVDTDTVRVTKTFTPVYEEDISVMKDQLAEIEALISKGGDEKQMQVWTDAVARIEADLSGAVSVGVESAIINEEITK